MKRARNTGLGSERLPLLAAALALSALSCSVFGGLFGGDQDPASQVSTLEAELEAARTAASEQEGTSVAEGRPSASGGVSVAETFDEPTEAFANLPGVETQEGSLLLGPFDRCANDVGNFDSAVSCLAPCQTCGQSLRDFTLSTSFAFAEGLSDREFGVILRFVDEGADGQLDRPDYLLAIGFNIYENRWRLYFHEPDEIEPWRVVRDDRAGFLTGGRLNMFEARAFNEGRRIEVRLNDARILILTGDHPEPGETLVEPWEDAGAVGLLGLGRGVQARFDRFELTPGP